MGKGRRRGDAPTQIININPVPEPAPRAPTLDLAVGCFLVVVGLGVALALVAGAIW